MEILVDYDNVPRADRMRGVSYVTDRILDALGPGPFRSVRNVRTRLYGGWYDGRTLTRNAQQIVAELLRTFPMPKTLSDPLSSETVIVNAELAYSLLTDPTWHLLHTYRPRSAPRDLNCRRPSTVGCATTPCALDATHQLFLTRSCPMAGCSCNLDDLIFRGEQKLVDTMLAADLFWLAVNKADRVCIVTSDDDVWPAMKTALNMGTAILHVHTHSGRVTPHHYSSRGGREYIETSL